MQRTSSHNRSPNAMDRRTALRRLGAILLAAGTAGCTRDMLLGIVYPEAGGLEPDSVGRTLTAFVATIVPEFAAPERIVPLFADPSLPMAQFHRVLAADLARRTRERAGHDRFDRLAPRERHVLVADGLTAGGIPGRLYNGAVLFTQVLVYGGLGSDDGSCPLAGFEGAFQFRGQTVQTYPDSVSFFARTVTSDGNPW
jgi:hypothetical protein